MPSVQKAVYLDGAERKDLTLVDFTVNANIIGAVANVALCQTFKNVLTKPVEILYQVPLSDKITITSVRMNLDGREIVCELKAKEEAKADYSEA